MTTEKKPRTDWEKPDEKKKIRFLRRQQEEQEAGKRLKEFFDSYKKEDDATPNKV